MNWYSLNLEYKNYFWKNRFVLKIFRNCFSGNRVRLVNELWDTVWHLPETKFILSILAHKKFVIMALQRLLLAEMAFPTTEQFRSQSLCTVRRRRPWVLSTSKTVFFKQTYIQHLFNFSQNLLLTNRFWSPKVWYSIIRIQKIDR